MKNETIESSNVEEIDDLVDVVTGDEDFTPSTMNDYMPCKCFSLILF